MMQELQLLLPPDLLTSNPRATRLQLHGGRAIKHHARQQQLQQMDVAAAAAGAGASAGGLLIIKASTQAHIIAMEEKVGKAG